MGISSSKTKKIQKDTCPNCGPDTSTDIVTEHTFTEPMEEYDDAWFAFEYQILKCRGCEKIYFKKTTSCSEWGKDHLYHPITNAIIGEKYIEEIEYYPKYRLKGLPDWHKKLEPIDEVLFSIFMEVYRAHNNELNVLTAIGVRTTFDRASEILEIEPNLSFAKKLIKLADDNLISATEKDALKVLIEAGSAAAHRAWRPTQSELENMLSILESFLHRSFIVNDDAKSLKLSVPPKR